MIPPLAFLLTTVLTTLSSPLLLAGSRLPPTLLEMKWVFPDTAPLFFSFFIDTYSIYFLFIVLLITSCVMLYSEPYFASPTEMQRFQPLLLLFSFTICLLISAPRLEALLLG